MKSEIYSRLVKGSSHASAPASLLKPALKRKMRYQGLFLQETRHLPSVRARRSDTSRILAKRIGNPSIGEAFKTNLDSSNNGTTYTPLVACGSCAWAAMPCTPPVPAPGRIEVFREPACGRPADPFMTGSGKAEKGATADPFALAVLEGWRLAFLGRTAVISWCPGATVVPF